MSNEVKQWMKDAVKEMFQAAGTKPAPETLDRCAQYIAKHAPVESETPAQLLNRINKLPRHPFHTWNDQDLIGLDDVRASLARATEEKKS